MLISNSRRFIFVHIIKAAGTSVTCALERTLKWNDVMLGGSSFGEQIQEPYRQQFQLHKHSNATEIKSVVGGKVWEDYFTFSFVRHPFARAVSVYTFIDTLVRRYGMRPCLRVVPSGRLRERIWEWPPTKSLVDSMVRRQSVKQILSRIHARRAAGDIWCWPITKAYLATNSFSEFIRHKEFETDQGSQPQVRWLQDANGRMIVDFVGKVENLHDDLNHVGKRIGGRIGALERLNQSNRGKERAELLQQADDRRYLFDKYREDFEAFEYEPDLDAVRERSGSASSETRIGAAALRQVPVTATASPGQSKDRSGN